jgi:hypothetical protein
LVAFLPVCPAIAYTIDLDSSGATHLRTSANDQLAGGAVLRILNPATIPYSATSSSIDGGTSSASEYDFSNDGFSITFEHARVGTNDSYGQSFGRVLFSVDQNVHYAAAGSYAAIDPDGRSVTLNADLLDLTVGSYLFEASQWSESTPNESFTLGLAEGDFYNLNTGSLVGTLIAGHDYRFFYSARVRTIPSASPLGATGSGSVFLGFTAVPEPDTAVLAALGLVVLTVSRRRSRASI